MTTSRQSIRTLITDLSEVLAWGEAAETANAAICAERDAAIAQCADKTAELVQVHDDLQAAYNNEVQLNATIAEKDATIAAKDAEILTLQQENADYHDIAERHIAEIYQQRDEIERLKAELSIFKTGGASPGNGET